MITCSTTEFGFIIPGAHTSNGTLIDASLPIVCPPSMYLTATDSSKTFGNVTSPQTKVNYRDIPKWVKEQRYSWHGVDYMYHGTIAFDAFYRRYLETLQAVDESVEEIIA